MAAWAELASGATGVWRAEFGMDVLVEPGHSCERNGRAPGIMGREPVGCRYAKDRDGTSSDQSSEMSAAAWLRNT